MCPCEHSYAHVSTRCNTALLQPDVAARLDMDMHRNERAPVSAHALNTLHPSCSSRAWRPVCAQVPEGVLQARLFRTRCSRAPTATHRVARLHEGMCL